MNKAAISSETFTEGFDVGAEGKTMLEVQNAVNKFFQAHPETNEVYSYAVFEEQGANLPVECRNAWNFCSHVAEDGVEGYEVEEHGVWDSVIRRP